jgi:serine/threonine protein kinase
MTIDPHGVSSYAQGGLKSDLPAQTPAVPDLSPTKIPLPQPGADSSSHSTGRYQLRERDECRLYAAQDRLLDRQVTARLASLAQADDLEREARFIARLDHAGIPTVLDFMRNDTGAMLILRRIDGITLSEGIARAVAGNPPLELGSTIAIVQVVLRICETVGAAHARNVVHRRIIPDNILLGWQGQVVVLDWSMAMEENIRPLTVRYIGSPTPSAISVLDGLHQDVRGIGLCLLSALIRRQPDVNGTPALATLTAEETRSLPPSLLAIVKCALITDASGGYASISALVSDLERFIEGLEPVAYRPGLLRRSVRWIGAHRLIALTLLFAISLAASLWLPRLREHLAWGKPVLVETFSDDSYKNRWLEPSFSGMFHVAEGRLVSIAPRGADLIYRERLTTPLAIEYTGEILAGSSPCDLSVTWREQSLEQSDGVILAGGGRNLSMQFGGYNNSCSLINSSTSRLPVAYSKDRLEPGRRHHFRVEIVEKTATMWMDGRKILQYEDPCPFLSGHIALYAHFPGKAFDDLRIYQKRPSDTLSPLCLGDSFFSNSAYDQALSMYAKVADVYAGRPERQEALFRKGLSEWHLGRRELALATWKDVTEPELADQVAYHVVQIQDAQQQSAFFHAFAQRYQQEPAKRPVLVNDWNRIMRRLAAEPSTDPHLVDHLLRLREGLFPGEALPAYLASRTLLAHRRFMDCIKLFPDDNITHGQALLALGCTQEVIDAPWSTHDNRIKAYQMRGDFAILLADNAVIPSWRVNTLCASGRATEALADADFRYPALLHLGRAEELLVTRNLTPRAVNDTLMCLGRLEEAAGAGLPQFPGSGHSVVAQLLLGDVARAEVMQPQPSFRFMMACEARNETEMERLRSIVSMPRDFSVGGGWFVPAIVRPLVDRWNGDATALDQQIRPHLLFYSGVYGKRLWFVARAILGDIPPESVLEMPAAGEAPAWESVTRGIVEELAGRSAEALAAYSTFTGMPRHRRLMATSAPDPEVEWFVRWRIRSLSSQDR